MDYFRSTAADGTRSFHPVPIVPMLSTRRPSAELMDAPDIDPARHLQALEGLRRINQISRAANVMLRPILAFAKRRQLTRLRLLDVASGGGDVPIELARLARRAGPTIDLTLFDISPTALEHAAECARRVGIEVMTQRGNAAEGLPDGPFDVVTNSLFLHHLARPDVTRVLANMKAVTNGVMVVSDLRRSSLGLIAAHIGCRLLSRSDVVHCDGPVSVKAAWTMEELSQLATEAGLNGAKFSRHWPWRMLLTWEQHG